MSGGDKCPLPRRSRCLEPELGTSYCFDGVHRASKVDFGHVLTPEQVEQQFAGLAHDPDRRRPAPCSCSLPGHGVPEIQPGPIEPTGEVPGPAACVCPQGIVHDRVERSARATVRAAHILMVDEELVEVGHPAQPTESEHPRGPGAVVATSSAKSLDIASFRLRSANRAHGPGMTSPGPANESCSRKNRCAAKSRVVHGSRTVAASGPNPSSRSHSSALSSPST